MVGRRVVHTGRELSDHTGRVEHVFETSGASPRAGGCVAGGAYAAVDSPALIDPLSPAEVDAQFEALVRDAEIRAWTLEDLDPSRVDHTAALLRQPPGAVTAAAIDECTRTVADLPDADVVELTAAAHRLASWALSTQLMAMAELHRRWSTPPPGWGGASARQVADERTWPGAPRWRRWLWRAASASMPPGSG